MKYGRHKHSRRKRRNAGRPAGHSRRIALRREQCRVYSRCCATIVRWAVVLDPLLGNSSVNTFPLQRLRMQRGKRGVVYVIRSEEL
jgi:hypothetical protein